MAKIKLSKGGFTLISEGEHVFKITKSTYDEDFGKLEIKMVTSNGQKHTERFSLITNAGEINEGAQNAFSYFAKTALNDFNLDEIDTDDIVDCYIKGNVEHEVLPHRDDPKKTVTFVRLEKISPATGFEDIKEAPTIKPTPTATVDLDALLG